jgi:hypothetical protein
MGGSYLLDYRLDYVDYAGLAWTGLDWLKNGKEE